MRYEEPFIQTISKPTTFIAGSGPGNKTASCHEGGGVSTGSAYEVDE